PVSPGPPPRSPDQNHACGFYSTHLPSRNPHNPMKTKERCHVYPSQKWRGSNFNAPRPARSNWMIAASRKTKALCKLLAIGTFVKLRRHPRIGEVSERLKELASKASVGETQPWVRIPPSPPYPQVPSIIIISTRATGIAFFAAITAPWMSLHRPSPLPTNRLHIDTPFWFRYSKHRCHVE